MAPTCGAEPRAAVEAADSDDEEGMGAGAVLIQVGALCCPVDVAELEDLGGARGGGGVRRACPKPTTPPVTPRDIT